MPKQLVIIGAGGHGRVVADIAKKCGYEQIFFLDDNISTGECGGYPIVGTVSRCAEFDCDQFVAVGNCAVREQLLEQLRQLKKRIPVLIHPSAVIGENVTIGNGTVIVAGAVVNPGAIIGEGCIINTCASVDHDCLLDDFVHVAIGAHVAGSVSVGKGAWIGAGATVRNNVRICAGCMVGMGAAVVGDIVEKGTYIGVPARIV